MRPWMTFLVLAVALVSRPGPASADWITIEPDAFAPGTDVTHATPGVTLWTMTPQDPLTVLLTATYVRQNPECLTGPAMPSPVRRDSVQTLAQPDLSTGSMGMPRRSIFVSA